MKIQVLVATMNQQNIEKLLEEMNISTEAIITNQTNAFFYKEIRYKNNDIKIYNFNEKGVGLNRNNSLMRADGDIILIADDDIRYIDNYAEIVLREFEEKPDADIIIFNIFSKDQERNRYVIKKNKRIYTYNCLRYGAVRMAIKLDSIKNKNIFFSLLFGGGAKYGSGEDSIFIYNCIRSGLKAYSSTKEILMLRENESTWFKGYDEKFFYDKGALLASIFKRKSCITIPIFILKNRKMTNKIGIRKAYKNMINGYKEFLNKR